MQSPISSEKAHVSSSQTKVKDEQRRADNLQDRLVTEKEAVSALRFQNADYRASEEMLKQSLQELENKLKIECDETELDKQRHSASIAALNETSAIREKEIAALREHVIELQNQLAELLDKRGSEI
jgi:chromosome segregation ATPase